MEVLSLTQEHWDKVREIYLAGIASGDATFETIAPSWEEWDKAHLKFARLIARANSEIKGWAAFILMERRSTVVGTD